MCYGYPRASVPPSTPNASFSKVEEAIRPEISLIMILRMRILYE